MDLLKLLNKNLIVQVSCFILLASSICSCTANTKKFAQELMFPIENKKVVQKPTFPIQNKDLVEVCLKDSLERQNPSQALKLEDSNSSVNCIVYET